MACPRCHLQPVFVDHRSIPEVAWPGRVSTYQLLDEADPELPLPEVRFPTGFLRPRICRCCGMLYCPRERVDVPSLGDG